MPQTLAFSSSLKTLKFSVHNTFETRLFIKIFDAEFPNKLSYFEPLCLPTKMAAEAVTRPIIRLTSMFFNNNRRQVTEESTIGTA